MALGFPVSFDGRNQEGGGWLWYGGREWTYLRFVEEFDGDADCGGHGFVDGFRVSLFCW